MENNLHLIGTIVTRSHALQGVKQINKSSGGGGGGGIVDVVVVEKGISFSLSNETSPDLFSIPLRTLQGGFPRL